MEDDGSAAGGHDHAMTKHLIRRLRANRGQEDGDERQSAEDRKWAFVSERTDFQEVAG